MKRKNLVFVVILLVCLLAVSGCKGVSGENGADTTAKPEETTARPEETTALSDTTALETEKEPETTEKEETTAPINDPSGGIITGEYSNKINEGYSLPSKEQLEGTKWYAEEIVDGIKKTYTIVFNSETATVLWNDGIDVEDHEYSGAAWSIETVNGFAVLTLDLGQLEGINHYDILIDEAANKLFIAVDITGEFEKYEYEPYFRTLDKIN